MEIKEVEKLRYLKVMPLVVAVVMISYLCASISVYALEEPLLLMKYEAVLEIGKLSFLNDESNTLVAKVHGPDGVRDYLLIFDSGGNKIKELVIEKDLPDFATVSNGFVIISIRPWPPGSISYYDGEGNFKTRLELYNELGPLYEGALISSKDGSAVCAMSYHKGLCFEINTSTDNIFSQIPIDTSTGDILSQIQETFDTYYNWKSIDGAYTSGTGTSYKPLSLISKEGDTLWQYEIDRGDNIIERAVSPDGRYVAVGTSNGKIYLFENKEHMPLAEEAIVTPEENKTAIEETPPAPTIADIISDQDIYSQTENISISGIITRVLNAGESTFVEIDDGTGKMWIVTPEKNVTVGEEVTSEGILMFDFLSETLGKTFGTVLFPETSLKAQDLTTASPTTTPAPMPSPTATTPATSPPTLPPPTPSVSDGFVIDKPIMYGAGIAIFLAFVASIVLSIRGKRIPRKATGEIKPAAPKAGAKPEKISGPAIDVMELSKSYKDVKILDGVNFQLEQGKLCAVVGPSGGGKSTIIESITGRLTPDEGKIQIMGMDVGKERDDINKLVGFVPQHPELYMDQPVWQNMMNSALKWSVKDADARSENILKQLGIFERKDVAAKNLSGGQLKRLSLGMELIREPPILVLDEPTTGLDPTSRDQILSALSKIVFTEKKTAILTTHFMDEAEHCDEVIIVGNAKILAKGAPSELARRMPGMGKIVQVTLEEVGDDLVSKVEEIEGVKKVIREGRVLKIIMDSPDSVEISQKIKEFGGIIEGSKIAKARMKEVFVYYTGVYPEE